VELLYEFLKTKDMRIIDKMRTLNARGFGVPDELEPRRHQFSPAWLAGLVDGDGCISVGAWKFRRRDGRKHTLIKPYLKISLAHIKTIEYLSSVFNVGVLKSGKELSCGTRRRKMRAVRILPEKLSIWLPKLIPHLRLKRRQAELALEIIRLRNSRTNDGFLDHVHTGRVSALCSELKKLNRRKKNDKPVC